LGNGQEVGSVLAGDKLFASGRVRLEELLHKFNGVVKFQEALKNGWAHFASEPLLYAAAEVSSKVAKAQIDPTLLVGDIHESDHAKHDLFIGHLSDGIHNRAVLLLRKPGLRKVAVELFDDGLLVLCQPGSTLILGKLENGVIELLPELDPPSGNLVDGFSEL